jgi:hypothetical protein
LKHSASPDHHARYRARVKAGIACTTVEFDGPVVDMLVKLRWLQEGEACDRQAVGRAIAAMVADAARR